MAFFGKKKYEDNDETVDIEEIKKEKRLERKLKDLEPKNKRKRKEPPKPWGKKERYLVLAVFVATLAIAGLLALKARGYIKLVRDVQFSLPRPDFKIFKDETIELRKK